MHEDGVCLNNYDRFKNFNFLDSIYLVEEEEEEEEPYYIYV
jgi:hypothetical protein